VGARQEADLDRDRAELRGPAAVHPEALVEGQGAAGLLEHEVVEVLADPGLAARGIELRLRLVLRGPVGPDRVGDLALQGRDAARQVVREPEQEAGRRLGVRQRPVVLGQVDPEERRERVQLVVLEVRIALAGDRQRVEEAARVVVGGAAAGLLEEAEVEVDAVADDERVTDVVDGLLRRLGRRRPLGDVLVGDAVDLVAEDRLRRLDEGRPPVGDLAALDLDDGDLEEVGHLRVRAGGLDVDDRELAVRVHGRDEVEEPSPCRARGPA
jgi:hypothetical protein